jgi:hypothetical protein
LNHLKDKYQVQFLYGGQCRFKLMAMEITEEMNTTN